MTAITAIGGIIWAVWVSVFCCAALLAAGSIVSGDDPALYGVLGAVSVLLLIALMLLARRRGRAFRLGQILGLALMVIVVPIGVFFFLRRLPPGVVRPPMPR